MFETTQKVKWRGLCVQLHWSSNWSLSGVSLRFETGTLISVAPFTDLKGASRVVCVFFVLFYKIMFFTEVLVFYRNNIQSSKLVFT